MTDNKKVQWITDYWEGDDCSHCPYCKYYHQGDGTDGPDDPNICAILELDLRPGNCLALKMSES